MTRREIIQYTSLLTGAAVGVPLMTTILSGCHESPSTTVDADSLLFFETGDFDLLGQIVDVILPKTDSPSATAVGVPQLIDRMIGEVYKPEDQKAYQANYAKLSSYLTEDGTDRALIASRIKELANDKESDVYPAFLTLKQQSIAFYLSTEEVSKNHLNYLPIPGTYEGCITTESVNNKAWA